MLPTQPIFTLFGIIIHDKSRMREIKTRIIKINPKFIELDKIKTIAYILKRQGVIAYPTDTFYGLGADCFSPEGIRRIYNLKKRKEIKPLPVIISDVDVVKKIAAEIPPCFWPLSREFWPGPLTLVLKASSKLPRGLIGPSQTIGIRLPALSWLRELVRETDFPLTATSANISGEKGIFQVEKIIEIFWGKVDLIVDGGKTPGTKPSTVLDLALEKPKLLRRGAIPEKKFRRYLEI